MDFVRLMSAMRDGAIGEIQACARSVLDAIAGGQLAINAIQHPLEFACLPVYRDRASRNGICVHLWGHAGADREALRRSPIHCHSWDLLSHVLYGAVENRQYRVTDTDEPAAYRVFKVDTKSSLVDKIAPTSRLVQAAHTSTTTCQQGEYYELPAGEFHRSALPDGIESATMVLGTHQPTVDNLVLHSRATSRREETRVKYSTAETRELAAVAWERLALAPAVA